jgi:glycosyltransferase involved in cell wall biosynthesis
MISNCREPLRTILQLINLRRMPSVDADTPDRHCMPPLLPAGTWQTRVLPILPWPWNPGARRHEAFGGIDPLRALRVLLTQRSVALVCAHFESAAVVLLLRRWLRFKPPVVIWEVPWSPGWRYREWLSRLVLPRADCVVVFSSNQIELVRQQYGPRTMVAFVRFCIDLGFFRPQPGVVPKARQILSAGLDVGRDFDVVLRATQGLGVQLCLKTQSRAIAADRQAEVTLIAERLSFVDYRRLYEDAAIVVVATAATPNACGVTSLMEALAMGRPTIVSNNPALRDYLPPPGAGIVIPIGDDAALRRALMHLLEHPDEARAMGRQARLFAEQQFNPQRHAQDASTLFQSILAARPGQGSPPVTGG